MGSVNRVIHAFSNGTTMKLLHRLPLLAVLGLALPATVAAQQGAITYDRATRLALELPPGIQERIGDQIPGETFDRFVLLFSPEETVMIPADVPEEEVSGPPSGGNGRIQGMMDRMQRMSPERTDQESLQVVHTDLTAGALVENRVFMGRNFLVRGERPALQWRLTGEQSEFAGHLVIKALATLDTTEVEAWFTPQIPVPGGPGEFGGLPGMILSLSIDGGRIIYSAMDVRMMPVDDGAIRPPTQGEEVTRADYEEIVEERLEELRALREQRGRRRGGQ